MHLSDGYLGDIVVNETELATLDVLGLDFPKTLPSSD
jgi:hypothetical protein